MTHFKYFRLIVLVLFFNIFFVQKINAAYLLDDTNAIYTDDFANNSGIPSRSYLNISGGFLQLTSAASQSTFTTPLAVGGSAITGVIKPVQIAKWGILSIAATIPANTTLKVQILDDGNTPWQDSYLPGNSVGVAVSDSLDLSNIPVITCADGDICNKPYAMKIRFIMSTGDTGITPKINSISLIWTKNQGDLSATVYDSGPWSSTYGNKERTVSSPYTNSSVYPAFKWASEKYVGDLYYNSMFVDTDKIIGHVDNNYDYFFARNRDNGEELWKIPCGYVGYQGLIAANNTFYGSDMLGDAAYAVDTTTGLVKWVYDFTAGGHGTDGVLGSDGTLYVLRNMTVGNTGSLYAFNPDGSLKSRTFLTLFDVPTEAFSFSEMAVGDSGVVYFTTATYNESTYESTNHGKLTSLNLSTGTSLWSYSSGNLSNYYAPIIGPDGTIYVTTENQYDGLLFTHTLFAVNSNGTLKWRRDTTDVGRGYFSLSLRNDGVLLAQRGVSSSYSTPLKLEAINTSDGTLLWSKDIEYSSIYFSFSDGNNGLYYSDTPSSGISHGYYTRMNYLDSFGNSKWIIKYPYVYDIEPGKIIGYDLEIVRPDERGWLYGGFTKSASTTSYDRLPLETWNQTYALSPWTLTQSSTIQSNLYTGDNMTFTAVTSMGTTNPLFGGDNLVQVYLDTGATFPLSYSHTDSNGNTVWTATYYLPDNTPLGTHTYTVEASQAHLQTDITTHFSSAPTESLNTGITATPQSFNVVPRTQESSPDSNDHTCRDSKPISTPDLFQINTNGNSAKLFFSPVPSMNHYYISFSTKSNAEDHSADVTLAPEGVQNYTITQLKPNTTYYFKIRAQNGCTPGDWSNIFKVNTRARGVTKVTSFFKKNQPKTNSAASTIIRKTTNYTKKLTNSTPQFINPPKDTLLNPQSNSPVIDTPSTTQTNTPIIQPTPTPKKFCILWWCL